MSDMMRKSAPDGWGSWGDEPACEHLVALRNMLQLTGLCVYSESGEPDLWVNVSCEHCKRTYEVSFRDDLQEGDY